ncbi:MAG: hypothetical protein V4724_21695 [Pseudomonadota bacterium]
MLNEKCIVDGISQALKDLEEQGELVITSTTPEKLARLIFHAALENWFKEMGEIEEPIECTITHLLGRTVAETEAKFDLQNSRAREVVNSYYREWLKTRSIKEIAEIFWHETPQEMANRAYYHIELGKPDNRDLEYSAWAWRPKVAE